MNVLTPHELGRALKLAIEASQAGNIPAVSDSTATPKESERVQADTIRRWVRGENEPAALQLARVALVVNVSLDSLVYDTEIRPVVLSSVESWSFSEKQMADLLEGFRALDQLNRLVKKQNPQRDVVGPFCAAPKMALSAVLACSSNPPNNRNGQEYKIVIKT